MAKTIVQFHALPTEVIDFAVEWAKTYDLYLVRSRLFPEFEVALVAAPDIDSSVVDINEWQMITLCRTAPDVNIPDYNDYMESTVGCLVIDVGRHKDNELKESAVSAVCDDNEEMKLWKTIIKKFKSTLMSGAWAVNPYTGDKGYEKYHRYTEAAKSAYENGTKILPFAGCNYYVLSDQIED